MNNILILLALVNVAAFAAEAPSLPTAHTARTIEGWTVRVDDRLLHGDGAAVGERALKLLGARLVAITVVVPEESLAPLRAITIQLDLDYGDLRAMQYHPDAGWLKEHGYSEHLAKCVHIPEAEDFLSPEENHRMPWVVLHELAHGFHDQTIGFEDARVIAEWNKFRDSGEYQSVLTTSGQMREHYGLTDPKEFFAEMTECYFGSNDFYPFVAGELKRAEPETFALLAEIWGPLPGSAPLASTMQLETTNEHEFKRMGQGMAASRSVASEASSVEAPGCRAKSTKMPVFIGVHSCGFLVVLNRPGLEPEATQ